MKEEEIAAHLEEQYARVLDEPTAPSQFEALSPAFYEGHAGYEIRYVNAAGVRCVSLVSADVTAGELDDLMKAR